MKNVGTSRLSMTTEGKPGMTARDNDHGHGKRVASNDLPARPPLRDK
jgi:hypothetical protein